MTLRNLCPLLLVLAGAPALANQALATKHGCLGCHAAAAKLVGPSYADVAAKYKGEPGAPAALAQRIRDGSVGKWGDVAMPPQKQLSGADAKRLAAWIIGGAK